jgi:predicted RNA-binding Zn-ribbon protein involved in translation (DUF1610 family)
MQRIVFMKAAQVSATEAGNNWIGFAIHQAPGPMLAVQPTVELAKRNSRQRIDPLIDESPELRERVKPARSRDAGNTMLSKEFAGGILIMTGANSAVGLRSTPARYIFLDEVDAYPASADEEGDPVTLAEARSLTFAHRRKVLLVSTPTIRGLSRIEREYEASDQRRFFVPCPHCGHAQWLKFDRLRWQKGRPETAEYHCEGCDAAIAEHHKTAMLDRGALCRQHAGQPGDQRRSRRDQFRLCPALRRGLHLHRPCRLSAAPPHRDFRTAGRAGHLRLAGGARQRGGPNVHRNPDQRSGGLLMIRLNLTAGPEWLDLAPGLRLQVAPLTTAVMVSARADAAVEALPQDASQEDLALAMAKAIARRAVLDWEGVGDDEGNPVLVTPEGIDALLEIWPVFEAFQTSYVARGLILDAEKNASAPSPTGPSAGATDTAQPVPAPAPTAPQD